MKREFQFILSAFLMYLSLRIVDTTILCFINFYQYLTIKVPSAFLYNPPTGSPAVTAAALSAYVLQPTIIAGVRSVAFFTIWSLALVAGEVIPIPNVPDPEILILSKLEVSKDIGVAVSVLNTNPVLAVPWVAICPAALLSA